MAKAKEEVEEKKEMKYGIEDLSKEVDRDPTSCRRWLREHDIPKAGRSYGWDLATEYKDIAKQMKESKPRAAAKEEKAPAKKATAKKATTKKKTAVTKAVVKRKKKEPDAEQAAA